MIYWVTVYPIAEKVAEKSSLFERFAQYAQQTLNTYGIFKGP